MEREGPPSATDGDRGRTALPECVGTPTKLATFFGDRSLTVTETETGSGGRSAEVPELFNKGYRTGGAFDDVVDDEGIGIEMNPPAVRVAMRAANGFGGIVRSSDEANFGTAVPGEWTGGYGLVVAIDTNGVVGGRGAKVVPKDRIGDVGAGTGVGQDLLAGGPEEDLESVGMGVTSAEWTEAAGVE